MFTHNSGKKYVHHESKEKLRLSRVLEKYAFFKNLRTNKLIEILENIYSAKKIRSWVLVKNIHLGKIW